jgi:hypothetical protein
LLGCIQQLLQLRFQLVHLLPLSFHLLLLRSDGLAQGLDVFRHGRGTIPWRLLGFATWGLGHQVCGQYQDYGHT